MTYTSSLANAPVQGLSLRERDRRWTATRELMRKLDLDLLLVGGFRSRDHYEHFLSNDYIEGAVVFPLAENPVTVTWGDTRIHRAEDSFARGVIRWINDYRTGLDGGAVSGLITELSARGRIGIVGLDTQTAGEFSGFIPARFWMDLTAGLPGREIVDVSWDFNEMMLPKSEVLAPTVRDDIEHRAVGDRGFSRFGRPQFIPSLLTRPASGASAKPGRPLVVYHIL